MNKKQMEARIKELEAQVSPKAPVLLSIYGKPQRIVKHTILYKGHGAWDHEIKDWLWHSGIPIIECEDT